MDYCIFYYKVNETITEVYLQNYYCKNLYEESERKEEIKD